MTDEDRSVRIARDALIIATKRLVHGEEWIDASSGVRCSLAPWDSILCRAVHLAVQKLQEAEASSEPEQIRPEKEPDHETE